MEDLKRQGDLPELTEESLSTFYYILYLFYLLLNLLGDFLRFKLQVTYMHILLLRHSVEV